MVKGACMVKGTCVIGSMHGRGMHDRGHAWQGHAWQGAFVVGVCMAGGMHGSWGVCDRGCAWQRRVHGRRDGHCSGWYASYWNAFLLIEKSYSRPIEFMLTF